MRHRRKGRHLGRSSSHRKAMLRNLACSLILTERDPAYYEGLFQADGKTEVNPPRYRGRVVTTLQKAKEVRPLVEKCITIAKKALAHQQAAEEFESTDERNSEGWKKWRESDNWQKWNAAMAPAVTARRRVFSMLRDKEAVELLFDEVAPRFVDRPGGYTRVLKLAFPRLGDAGTQGIIEFVGVHDRVKQKSEKPAFDVEDDDDVEEVVEEEVTEESVEETSEPTGEADSDAEASAEADESSEADAEEEKAE